MPNPRRETTRSGWRLATNDRDCTRAERGCALASVPREASRPTGRGAVCGGTAVGGATIAGGGDRLRTRRVGVRASTRRLTGERWRLRGWFANRRRPDLRTLRTLRTLCCPLTRSVKMKHADVVVRATDGPEINRQPVAGQNGRDRDRWVAAHGTVRTIRQVVAIRRFRASGNHGWYSVSRTDVASACE